VRLPPGYGCRGLIEAPGIGYDGPHIDTDQGSRMTPLDLQRAVAAFAAARSQARLVDALPADATPRTTAEAYRIQAELARIAGGYRGWKVGALTPEQRARIGVETPTAARLLEPHVHQSPTLVPHRRYVRPLVECEIAFAMARDLPPRAAPYGVEEIHAAIGAMHLAIEIADSRLPPGPSLAMNLADAMASGAFVVGPAIASWASMDRGAIEVVLEVNGVEAARGLGASVLGDPLRAVALLADNPVPGSPGLRRGDYVTTGSLTGATAVAAGDVAVARFGFLGTVEVSFAP
jgi:2-keto-4-pentenoate hydratase